MTPKNTVLNNGERAKFIRDHAHLDATALVNKASEKGMKLTTNYVYNLRSTDKKKRLVVSKSVAGTADAESQLRELVLRIGLDRLNKVMSELNKFLGKGK
jgi:hypothetical protein